MEAIVITAGGGRSREGCSRWCKTLWLFIHKMWTVLGGSKKSLYLYAGAYTARTVKQAKSNAERVEGYAGGVVRRAGVTNPTNR